MSAGSGPRRAIAAVALLVLVTAVALLIRERSDPDPAPPAPTSAPSTPVAAPSAGPSTPMPGMEDEDAQRLLGSVEAAAAAAPDELLRAGLVAGRGSWRELSSPAWPMRGERPVYVGEVVVEGDAVEADVVIALRVTEPTGTLVLRLLPAALGDNALRVDVSVGGQAADSEPDAGGLLSIALPERHPSGSALAVRVRLSYRVLTTASATDDSGPAAYGILARSGDVTALGHWLPLLTFEPEPLVPWGDVGSFPVAVWSLQVQHEGMLVTGGSDGECPGTTTLACTWSRGLALRDVSAVVFDDGVEIASVASGLRVKAVAPDRIGRPVLETALDEAVRSAEGFTERFGALAWREFDVVAVPLGRGAAGVEFPGLVMIDDELYGAFSGGFGTYVVVHEVAHQWFHALVGNGSFADPVVDEPLAQYLSVLAYRDLFGPEAAQALVDDTMVARYRRFQDSGLAEEPPGQPSADFSGPETYGPLVYARAPLAWLAAEDAVGPEAVTGFLAGLVESYGLGEISADELVQDAAAVSEPLAAVLRRYWFTTEPVPDP